MWNSAFVNARPATGLWVMPDNTALRLKYENAVPRMRDDKIGLPIARATVFRRRLPGHAMKDDILVVQRVAECCIQLALRRTVGIGVEPVWIHPRHVMYSLQTARRVPDNLGAAAAQSPNRGQS